MNVVLRVVITAVAIWLASLWLDGIEIARASSTPEQILTVLVIAVVFVLVNAVVRPIVSFLSTPLYILTLGLFILVVNALMLMLTGWLTSFTRWGLTVDGFWTAVWGALIISVATWVMALLVPRSRRDRVRR
jgi:putative membrane protein